jgi:serine/threonine-protein kinase
MLTGVRAFGGGSSHEVLAKIVEREPAFSLLPSSTAPALRRLLRRCLDKSPQRRLGFIGDARLDLDDAITDATIEAAPSRWTPGRIAAAMLVTMALGVTLGALLWRRDPTDRVDQVSRFAIPLGRGEAVVTGFQPMVALSPDGRVLVYRANRDGVTRLYRRALHELEAQPIPGTENATGPFFSPDGRWLGFDSDGVLKRVSLRGGIPVVIAAAPGGVTSTWLSDDTIVFGSNTRRVLQRVSASGGEPEALTTLDLARGDTLHVLPEALPGRRAVLFTIVAGNNRHVASLDLDSRRIAILTEGAHARFMAPQHMLFARDGVLWGAVLDAGSSRLAGPPAPLVEGIEHTDNTVLHLAAGGDGSIVYLPAGQNFQGSQRFVWRDRQGRETPIGLEPRPYTRIALSPDNTRLAFTLSERGNTDIWIANLERGSMSRLTVDATIETMPTWSPDGRFVAFRSEREGPGLFRRDAQGAGEIERLTRTDGPIHSPYSWTPDGKTLLFALFRSFGRQAIASVTPPDSTVRVLLDGEFAQLDPQVSPDGRWLSYQSDETGRFEVYVRPYPQVTGARWQVSDAGGRTPRWSPDGRELFYYDGAALMSVPVSPAKEFTYGSSKRLFPIDLFGGRLGPDYEVSSDGRRFLFIVTRASPDAAPAHLVFVQHLDEDLRARLGR